MNTVNLLGLMARDEKLPYAAKELLRTTNRQLKKVMQDIGVVRDLNADETGFERRKSDGDHQWPIDKGQRWEAIK